ncbi:type II secretion system protein E [mine drainage metagenome]|uniref:Type II secretion system protein E n=1 Tax=mine drainage metagenome TaxID=410659 RepID=A0A1J5S0I0_9ZZZZ
MSAHFSNNDIQRLGVQPPEGLRKIVAFRDGVLFVANDYMTSADVIDFELKLRRMGALSRKQGVSMAQLSTHQHEAERVSSLVRRDEAAEKRRAFALLAQGVKMSASDIHFLIKSSHTEVKFRVDGYLDTYAELSKEEGIQLVTALYVASDSNAKSQNQFTFNTPIAARLTRSDGENIGLLPEALYAVRFASMKTDQGGLVVLRLLYDSVSSRSAGSETRIDLEALGFTATQATQLREMADAPNGMIIIDGPTGSGKSTTLKYTMQWIHENYPHFNILTVEDPPEYPIIGASQIPVSVQEDSREQVGERGKQYASIIATTLRLDPDILMVGEIRDGHSAIAGLRAAETGHRLWSTLHANDAWEAMNRLLDLLREGGMHEPLPVLANTQNLCGMVAQRLVPKLCPKCRKPFSEFHDRVSQQVRDELFDAIPNLDASTIYVRGDGCDLCVPTAEGDPEKQRLDKRRGIMGRTVVAEIVRPDQTLLDIARRDGIPAARRYWLKHRNGQVIADAALAKILAGVLDPQVAREFVGPLLTARQILSSLEADQMGMIA